jgi:hypothetical protein
VAIALPRHRRHIGSPSGFSPVRMALMNFASL